MKNLKFSISPLFLLFGILLFYFQVGGLFLAYLLAILLHELGHAVVAKKLGYQLNTIKLMPYGTQLSIENKIENLTDDLLISLAGPFVNLILIIVNIAIWWLFPVFYVYTELFVIANFISLMFNLLPVFPLDGGRVVLNLLSRKMNHQSAYKLMQIFGAVAAILFFLLFLVSAFYKLNATFFIISFFLMESSLSKTENIAYQTIFTMNATIKKLKKPKVTKGVVVTETITILNASKLLKPYYYTIFYVLNNENKVKKIITEYELKNWLLESKNDAILKELT